MFKVRPILALSAAFLLPTSAAGLQAQEQVGAGGDRPVRVSFSDSPELSEGNAGSEHADAQLGHVYPDYVSTDPGFPRKPLWERPGDYNGSHTMAPRYCQEETFRAGWPNDVRKHAICAVNDHYYAWYVGGGAGLPFLKNRHRTPTEGTWGLDYSLWKKPRTVWMKWTCGRYQGGEGAYETDHKPLFE